MKKTKIIGAITSAVLFMCIFTSCGRIKTAEELHKYAVRKYGDCTIVSKTETEEETSLVLHDKLQDFDYTINSKMYEETIDGAKIGSYQDTHSDFNVVLKKLTLDSVRSRLDEVCKNNDAIWDENDNNFIYIRATDEENAEKCALSCAEIIQSQNMNGRLDNCEITAYNDQTKEIYDAKRYGRIVLPEIRWISAQEDHDMFYIRMAHEQTDPKAEFLRKETGSFSETGADLEYVSYPTYGSFSNPENMDSPVTFYYFKSSKGKEYFLCDFLYYMNDKNNEPKCYTNYSK